MQNLIYMLNVEFILHIIKQERIFLVIPGNETTEQGKIIKSAINNRYYQKS